jgi:hypothetical protein
MFRKVGILNEDNYRNISNSFYKIFSI